MTAAPKLSVLMITYNHEAYVEQAVRSALMQETDFEYEIVIGDDCSTDRTGEILLRLAADNPFRVRLLSRDRNLGMMANFADTYRACRGQYLALLEGDDYWTDPRKLARQVAFLDDHPGYAGCAHVVRQLGDRADYGPFPTACPNDITFEHLLAENRFATCSVVYRRRLASLPVWFRDCAMGDWPLHIVHAAYGPFRVFREVMGVYRIHEGGVWSPTGRAWRLRHAVALYRHLQAEFPEHGSWLDRYRFRWEYELGHELAARNDWPAARAVVRAMLPRAYRTGLGGAAQFLDVGLHVLTPPCYRFLSPPGRPAPTGPVEAVGLDQAEHLAARAAIRSGPRRARVSAIAREVLAGRYARFGLGPFGALSVAADLLG